VVGDRAKQFLFHGSIDHTQSSSEHLVWADSWIGWIDAIIQTSFLRVPETTEGSLSMFRGYGRVNIQGTGESECIDPQGIHLHRFSFSRGKGGVHPRGEGSDSYQVFIEGGDATLRICGQQFLDAGYHLPDKVIPFPEICILFQSVEKPECGITRSEGIGHPVGDKAIAYPSLEEPEHPFCFAEPAAGEKETRERDKCVPPPWIHEPVEPGVQCFPCIEIIGCPIQTSQGMGG